MQLRDIQLFKPQRTESSMTHKYPSQGCRSNTQLFGEKTDKMSCLKEACQSVGLPGALREL